MWFDVLDGAPDWRPALRYLRKADPVMAGLVRQVGPCTLSSRGDPFLTLVGSIFSQQLSTKGAMTLLARFRDQFPQRKLTPRRILSAIDGGPRAWDDQAIRSFGISRQKRAYLIDLCEHILSRRLILARLKDLDDEQVIAALSDVKGIGVWTSQMFLMFNLCRPDVLPALDLGIQESARRHYALKARPTPTALNELGEAWRPWRTIACWYLWRGLEG
jgi:DNA-3-methyladenine glycosylase II